MPARSSLVTRREGTWKPVARNSVRGIGLRPFGKERRFRPPPANAREPMDLAVTRAQYDAVRAAKHLPDVLKQALAKAAANGDGYTLHLTYEEATALNELCSWNVHTDAQGDVTPDTKVYDELVRAIMTHPEFRRTVGRSDCRTVNPNETNRTGVRDSRVSHPASRTRPKARNDVRRFHRHEGGGRPAALAGRPLGGVRGRHAVARGQPQRLPDLARGGRHRREPPAHPGAGVGSQPALVARWEDAGIPLDAAERAAGVGAGLDRRRGAARQQPFRRSRRAVLAAGREGLPRRQ